MNTANEALREYVAGLDASDAFKEIMIRVHELSRRKKERLGVLAQDEHARLEWDPGAEDFQMWKATKQAARGSWFVVLGLVHGFSAISPRLLTDEVAARVLRLLTALEDAPSANDVTAIPE